MFMVFFVLNNPDHLDSILEALADTGVSGITILESTGSYKHLTKRIPLRYTFGDHSSNEEGNITLFTIVPDEETVQACLQEIEKIVGDLDGPNTGIFSAWPLAITKGVPATTKK